MTKCVLKNANKNAPNALRTIELVPFAQLAERFGYVGKKLFSIIRPGRSRLLEFEKYLDQVVR